MSNDVINVGLVGYGLAGSVFHAPLINACARMKLAAVLTSRDVRSAVRSLDELIGRSDLVVVASPNVTHFEIARQALEAQCHVVIDKPITVTLDEADALIQVASDARKLLSVFQNRRWDADYQTVRELLPALGEPLLFEAHWDRYRPLIKRGWREMPAPGAGVFNDLGPHLVDQALQLYGMPDAIEADIVAQRQVAAVDDYFDVTLHYGRARVCLRSSSLAAAPRARFSILGTEGSFIKFGLDQQETQLKDGLDPRDPQFGVDPCLGSFVRPNGTAEPVPMRRGNYRFFYDAIAAAILDGKPVPVAAEDARNALAIIDLARRASDAGRRLTVPVSSSPAE